MSCVPECRPGFRVPAVILAVFVPALQAAEPAGVLFSEDFERGADRWEFLDPATWTVTDRGGNRVLEITQRRSAYQPPFRSPGHVALMRDVQAGSFELTVRVRSTKDTGAHRDCCLFFGWQDPARFYYVHLGARPDPASGQIMIVNRAARRPLTQNERPTPWTDNWHRVRLRRDVRTGEIAVYFDDMQKPHMQVRDTTFAAGRIGIGSFDDMNAFDDVILKELSP